MQSKDTRFPIKVGRVSIALDKGVYLRIRFQLNGIPYTLPFGKYMPERLDAAKAIAQTIDSDITFHRFDPTLDKYRFKPKKPTPINESVIVPVLTEPTLLEIWERYKLLKQKSTAHSTKELKWNILDRLIDRIPSDLLLLSNAEKFILKWRDIHSLGTIASHSTILMSAVNSAVRGKQIEYNPYKESLKLLLEKYEGRDNRTCVGYTYDELNRILHAFRTDEFRRKGDRYGYAHYATFVDFRMLTGCRPEESIALEWSDIKRRKDGKVYVSFTKAYTYGRLTDETKTGVDRIFPCNEQLIKLLDSLPKNHPKLLFPSFEGSYIDERNFNGRQWTNVTKALIDLGELEQFYPFYNIRHSYITELVRAGYDLKTIATWSGNSVKTILNNYVIVNHEIVPPTL